jgi:transposase
MANELKMAEIDAILTLHKSGHSKSEIGRMLGIHRETVAKYISQQDGPKPAEPDHRVRPGPSSVCEPLRDIILKKLDEDLSGQRIYQDLCTEHDFDGSYSSVRRFIARLGKSGQLPFRRLECEAAEEAQVDFGSGAPVVTAEGRRRKTHVFRIVLSHSRKGYSEAVFRQNTESFIRALENSFFHFGGTVKTLVIDNLRAAVQKADWYEPELHPKLRSFCAHYGVVILPTRPYTPRHKGKVESGVKYVKRNALKARRFSSLEEENEFLLGWETSVADKRIHGTTKQQVAKLFEEAERAALSPLPVERFPFFRESKHTVHRDGHVQVDKAYYSVPPEYFRREVWVRWDSRLVRIFNQQLEQIRVHVKQQTPGRFSTHPADIAPEKISGVERGTEWLLRRARAIGVHADRWAQQVIASRGIEGIRTVMGLISLSTRQPCRLIDKACEIADSYGAYKLKNVRQLIERQAPKQEQLEFMEEHPIIRNLDVYGDLVRNSLRKPPSHGRQGDSFQRPAGSD